MTRWGALHGARVWLRNARICRERGDRSGAALALRIAGAYRRYAVEHT